MKIEFLPAARDEFIGAVSYYDSRLTARFLHPIIYEARPGSVLIIGVMPLHRHPKNWQDRITEEPLR